MIRLYVMVSVPEPARENIFTPPIILGVFDSKESAKAAWKARTADFKDIKAKTVHIYCEFLPGEREALPQSVWLWANYQAYGYASDGTVRLYFVPYGDGFFATYEEYQARKAWLEQQNPTPWRKICENVGYIFFASNENIIEKFEINRLVRVPVVLTDVNEEI